MSTFERTNTRKRTSVPCVRSFVFADIRSAHRKLQVSDSVQTIKFILFHVSLRLTGQIHLDLFKMPALASFLVNSYGLSEGKQ